MYLSKLFCLDAWRAASLKTDNVLQVNPQLKGHLKGALNNGATEDEVRAVREIVLKICHTAGMRKLEDTEYGGWGWREDVAQI